MICSGTKLASGLEIHIADHTYRYFGDYHRVRLHVTSSIPLVQVVGLLPEELERASQTLPPIISFVKKIEKMGVASADLQTTKDELLTNFTTHTVPYLSNPDFPCRMVRSALRENNRKVHAGR